MPFRSFFAAAFIVIAVAVFAGEPKPYVAPKHEDLSIYHVFIDRFNNGTTANDDGNPRAPFNPTSGTGFHGGDLAGIQAKLPYIREMGFNGIWLSPLLESVGQYHAYSTYNWFNVEPNFGTKQELRDLVTQANKLGMAIYLDMVVNHCGGIINSGDAGFPAYLPPPDEYTLRWSGSLRYPAPFDSLSYFHAHGGIGDFSSPEQELGELSGLDDLKTETQFVRDQMFIIWSGWMNDVGISGFRIDTVKHVDYGFWNDFCPRMIAHAQSLGRENYFTFGEVFGADDGYMRTYTGTLTSNPYKLDACLDFQYYYMSNDVFANGTSGTNRFISRLNGRASQLGAHHFKTPNFFDNHDVPRFAGIADDSEGDEEQTSRLELAIVAIMTSPGPPVIYYGSEQYFNGGNDPQNREDMFDGQYEQGPSIGDNFDAESRAYVLIRRLNELRTALTPLRTGLLLSRATTGSGAGVLAYSRVDGDREVLVVLNTSDNQITTPEVTTTWDIGATVVEALGTKATAVIGANNRFPSRTLAPWGYEVWTLQSDAPPDTPRLISMTPDGTSTNVLPNVPVIVEFNQAMDIASVQAAFTIDPAIDVEFVATENDTRITISPVGGWAPRTTYTATLNPSAESAGGVAILIGAERVFHTSPVLGALPSVLGNLGKSTIAFTMNGDPTEWPAVDGLTPNHGGFSSNNDSFKWLDWAGDDIGAGAYEYPTNGIFTGNDADIEELRVAFDETNLYFLVKLVQTDAGGSFFTPYTGIAIDVEGVDMNPALGWTLNTTTTGVADLDIRGDHAPDFEIVYTGPIGGRLRGPNGSVVASLTAGLSRSTSTIEIQVPRSALGLEGELTGRILSMTAYAGLEEFGSLREVQTNAQEWVPGGGSGLTNDPDIFDLTGSATTEAQTADLSQFTAQSRSVVSNSILRIALFDTLPDEETASAGVVTY